MTKRDLGFDHEYICEKLEIIPGFHLASQKSIPNINQVFSLVLKLSWCCYWLYQMVWKDFWWYFIMFANSRNIMKHHSCPLCRVARRAATKDRHVCRFQASFWMVPQVCCMVLSYASTVRRQVFLGLLLLRFPSGVQWRAVWVMVSCSLLMTCPIHFHHLLMMMISMLSWLQWASSCWLEIVSGQKICRILLRFFVWKTDSSVMSLS